MPWRKFAVSVASSLWFVPVMCVLAGAAISFGTIALDRAFDYDAIPQVVGRSIRTAKDWEPAPRSSARFHARSRNTGGRAPRMSRTALGTLDVSVCVSKGKAIECIPCSRSICGITMLRVPRAPEWPGVLRSRLSTTPETTI